MARMSYKEFEKAMKNLMRSESALDSSWSLKINEIDIADEFGILLDCATDFLSLAMGDGNHYISWYMWDMDCGKQCDQWGKFKNDNGDTVEIHDLKSLYNAILMEE